MSITHLLHCIITEIKDEEKLESGTFIAFLSSSASRSAGDLHNDVIVWLKLPLISDLSSAIKSFIEHNENINTVAKLSANHCLWNYLTQ